MINPNEVSGLIEATNNTDWLHHIYRQCGNRLNALGKPVHVSEISPYIKPPENTLLVQAAQAASVARRVLHAKDVHKASFDPAEEITFNFDLEPSLGAEVEFTKPAPELEKLPQFSTPVIYKNEVIDETSQGVAAINGKSYLVNHLKVDGVTVGYKIGDYYVRSLKGRAVCTCLDFCYRTYLTPNGCKHVQALKPLWGNVTEISQEVPDVTQEPTEEKRPEHNSHTGATPVDAMAEGDGSGI